MIRKVVLGLVALLVVGAGLAYVSYGSVGRAGSGYAAKNLCSGYYLSGFPLEVTQEEALVGASDLLANISAKLGEEERSVTTRFFGLFERKAVYTPGAGCTLVPPGEDAGTIALQPLPALERPSDQPWPDGTAPALARARVQMIVEEGFAEDDPAGPRNTKAITVAHNGELIAEKYAPGVGPETPLIGWSMTKSVTALLVGLLVKDGALDVMEPAPVPQWQQEPGDPRAAITLDQLLRMSSGLEFQETYSAATDVTQMLSLESDAAGFAASKPLAGPPDTIWSYSSGTTNIISGIVRREVGGSLQETYAYSQNRLFRPLGIATATIEPDPDGTFIGSSYMYASARDWARLGQFVLQDGVWEGERLLPEGWVDYLTTPTKTSAANQYGAQFWLNRDPADPADPERQRLFPSLPADAYYMGGFQGQMVLVIPSHDLVITRFGFTPAENTGIEQIAARIIAQLERPQPQTGDEDETA